MKVLIYGALRSMVEENKEVEIPLTGRGSVQEVLAQLIEVYPGLRRKILSQEGELSAGILVFVNGRSIHFLDGLGTTLRDDDRLALFPPIAGG